MIRFSKKLFTNMPSCSSAHAISTGLWSISLHMMDPMIDSFPVCNFFATRDWAAFFSATTDGFRRLGFWTSEIDVGNRNLGLYNGDAKGKICFGRNDHDKNEEP